LEFTNAALQALAAMGKAQRRFPLKRPSACTERELRLDSWRVFYTVMHDTGFVIVQLIGEKRNNKLFVGGEEFEL
jgi:hypothetical protein